MNILESYRQLNPGAQRTVLVGGIFGVVLAVSTLLMSFIEREAAQRPRAEKPEVTVVAPTRMTGVEQFSSEMEGMKRQLQELQNQTRELREQNEEFKRKGAATEPDALSPDSPLPDPEADFFDPNTPSMAGEDPALTGIPPTDAEGFRLEAPPALPPPLDTASVPPSLPTAPSPEAPPTAPPPMQFRIIGEDGEMTNAELDEALSAEEEGEAKVYIPAGSMFTGVLLNGLDAPTTSAAQKNPTPVVMRVKREAVLPNYASIDVRECFLLAAGYGQLSSERVIMRAETLSCVRTDGKVFETKLDSYIVGTDGKVGLPGRLVSKQGQMIARSLLAGVFAGLGEAMDVKKVPSLNIDPGQKQAIYEQENVSSVFQSGAASGLSSASNMIAKFYLDMAKETFPVVEVPAGEVGTVVITRGGTLPLKGSASLELYVDASANAKHANANAPTASAPDSVSSFATASPPPPAAADSADPFAAVEKALDAANGPQRQTHSTFDNGGSW